MDNFRPVHLTECPRDAMQGLKDFVPTKTKIRYLNSLLKCGFQTLDFGSFVSPKAIPQMADTAEVLEGLDISGTSTKLLAIIANLRGAEQALQYDKISYIGFPLSVSETFQQRNTNKSIAEALAEVAQIQDLAVKHNLHLVVYLSMAFGNPYAEAYNTEMVENLAQKLNDWDIKHIALSDTIGIATPEGIEPLFSHLSKQLPKVQFAAHLHSNPVTAPEKIRASLNSGCRYFDSALKGYGGCPLATDTLTGNIDTETLLLELELAGYSHSIDRNYLQESLQIASEIFG